MVTPLPVSILQIPPTGGRQGVGVEGAPNPPLYYHMGRSMLYGMYAVCVCIGRKDTTPIGGTTFLKYIDEVLIDIGTSVNCSLLIFILSNVTSEQ